MTQKGESVTLTLYSSPKGRYHNPQPEGLLPPERKRAQPFYTTCGASRAPFFFICGEAATTPSEPFRLQGP